MCQKFILVFICVSSVDWKCIFIEVDTTVHQFE